MVDSFKHLCKKEVDTILSFHGKYRLILRRYYVDYMNRLPIADIARGVAHPNPIAYYPYDDDESLETTYPRPYMFLKILAESGRVKELSRGPYYSQGYGHDPELFMMLYRQKPPTMICHIPDGLSIDDSQLLLQHRNIHTDIKVRLHMFLHGNIFSHILHHADHSSKDAEILVRLMEKRYIDSCECLGGQALPFTPADMDDMYESGMLDMRVINGARIGMTVTMGVYEKKIKELEKEVRNLRAKMIDH